MLGTIPQPRPNPRLAWWLSILLPGAGQAYMGQLLLAPLFCAAWIVSIFGMLDVLTTFRNSPYQIPFALCALALGGGSWILSPLLARRRAECMTAHAPLYRWIARKLLLHILFMEEWPDLLLALGFAIVAVGHFSNISWLRWIAGQVMWWWPYELLGTFFLILYMAFLEGMSGRPVRPHHRLAILVCLFASLTGALHLLFHFPVRVLAVSGLILLPGYAPVLALGGERQRTRFLYRGGRAFCTLVLSFFPLGFLASMLEGPGVKTAGRAVFEGSIMVLWGTVYFFAKALFEAYNQAAAIELGEDRDPRWGSGGEER